MSLKPKMILGCVFFVLWLDLIYLISPANNLFESIKWAQGIYDRIENWFWPAIIKPQQKEIPQSLPINLTLPGSG
jgi:hypothetical protein